MSVGKTDLSELLSEMNPILNKGEYVFVHSNEMLDLKFSDVLCTFKEKEAITLILEKSKADQLNLAYDYIASWITLNVHSSLSAVGLTAAISDVLAKNTISCNVVAAYYHDHIFVNKKEANNAIALLKGLTNTHDRV